MGQTFVSRGLVFPQCPDDCELNARVTRTKFPEHGVNRIKVPWARSGRGFTLLFLRESGHVDCPVDAGARISFKL